MFLLVFSYNEISAALEGCLLTTAANAPGNYGARDTTLLIIPNTGYFLLCASVFFNENVIINRYFVLISNITVFFRKVNSMKVIEL